MPEIVVFDTNIWISGLMWRGRPYQCLLLARADVLEAAYYSQMAAELSQKLRTKFGFSEDRIQSVVYDYRRVGKRVEIEGNLRAVPDDLDDNKFVECAIVAGATAIISGDKHLLALGEYQGISVLTAAQCIVRFAD